MDPVFTCLPFTSDLTKRIEVCVVWGGISSGDLGGPKISHPSSREQVGDSNTYKTHFLRHVGRLFTW